MRVLVLILALAPFTATAQTATNPQAARQPGVSATTVIDDGAAPAMAPRKEVHPSMLEPFLSNNEAYNLVRQSEGRVGVRVGNDVQYRVAKRVVAN